MIIDFLSSQGVEKHLNWDTLSGRGAVASECLRIWQMLAVNPQRRVTYRVKAVFNTLALDLLVPVSS